jgi:hypothetical protein
MLFASHPPIDNGYLAALALGLIGVGLLVVACFRLRETTLVAPAAWAAAALVLLTCSCVFHGLIQFAYDRAEAAAEYSTWSYLRYAAAAFVIVPTLAQLGAKSPQNGAWQFIVVTLVVVLMLPVVQGWAYGDESPIVHLLFRWLLVAHVFLGVGNYLFTRFATSAILMGAGQVALIAEYLPFYSQPASSQRELLGLGCLVAAVGFACAVVQFRSRTERSLERLWGDFRDAFGAVWSLRIAERLNASARLHRWPVEFSWDGIAVTGEGRHGLPTTDLVGLEPELQHRIERELRSYLRRFVSHDWIAQRLPSPSGADAPHIAVESDSRG